MGTPTMGWEGGVAVEATASITGSSEIYEYTSEDVKKVGTIIDTNGIRGYRQHVVERVRTGPYTVGGTIVMPLSQTVVRKFFPRILGAAESGSSPYAYPIGDVLPTFSAMFARSAKDFQYDGLVVNKAIIRASSGQIVEIEMDWQGTSETVNNAGTFAALALTDPTEPPWIFHDATISIASTQYPIFDFELEIDNALVLDRFMNSTTRAYLPSQDQIFTLKTANPFTTSETGLYGQAITGAAVVLVLTNGVRILTMTMAAVNYPAESPTVKSRGAEIRLPLVGTARKTGSTNAFSAALAIA